MDLFPRINTHGKALAQKLGVKIGRSHWRATRMCKEKLSYKSFMELHNRIFTPLFVAALKQGAAKAR